MKTRLNALLERIDKTPCRTVAPAHSVIPFYDDTVFLALAKEAASSVGRHGGDDLIMVVDAHTARQLHAVAELRSYARQVFVYGDVPAVWGEMPNVCSYATAQGDLDEHVLLLISSTLSVSILGSKTGEEEHAREAGFVGGWTVERPYVLHAIEALVGDSAIPLLEEMTTPDPGPAQMADISMRLMTLHANALATREHDIAMDKNDLFSVLNILKAISAKRRSHDILFVFVEQISRVVSSDRCSVVRVWGGDKYGKVLASHEDASVNDCQIELQKYPELCKAMDTGKKVVINDVHSDPLTVPVLDELEKAHINAMLVIPIVLFDETIGSLFLRAARGKGSFSLREISFFEIVTEAASNALERAHLFESIQIANETLERLAITDGLTSLYNHRYFRDRLHQELERAQRYRLNLSCLIFDVDNFKQFNDTYGHLLGDSILKEIAARTQECVRKSDIVARYGGEEFVVIMPQTDLAGGLAEGERIRELIASRPFRDVPSGVQVTVSVGVGVLDHERMAVCEDLLKEADQALYEAKRTGKNKVVGPTQEEETA